MKKGGIHEDTLLFLLRSMMNKRVVIEMETNIELNGIISNIDDNMMITLSDVHQRHMYLHTIPITRKEEVTVLGKHIRYIHLPENLNVMSCMDRYVRIPDFLVYL